MKQLTCALALLLSACSSSTSPGVAPTDSATGDGVATDTAGDVGSDVIDSGGRVPTNHRADDSACGGVPGPGSCPGGGTCSKDDECTTGKNGRCVQNVGGGARFCFCSYDTCAKDSDCPTGKLCVCHGSPYTAGGNTCSDGGCRVDGDCGAGKFCSPSRGGGCGGLTGYFCHTLTDTCLDDGDCKGESGPPQICGFSSKTKRWECMEQMLCP